MKKIFLVLMLIPFLCFSQENGIHFQHNLSWKDIKAKARAEKKFIFMDCFTTWCGPCKYMSAKIFPLEEVGKVFNEHFISVKVQLDTTAEDNAEVKSWYKDGSDIAKENGVRAYPTYLFFDPNGRLVHRAIGSSEAEEFIAKAKDALDPNKQYYTLLNKYKAGKKDTALLRAVAMAAMNAYDMENATAVGKEYLATQTNLYTKPNLELLREITRSSADEGFKVMLNNEDKVDAVLGKGAAKEVIQNIVLQEELFPKLSQNETIEWDSFSASLKNKYPTYADELTAYSKVFYYQNKREWEKFGPAVVAYVNSYGAALNPEQLNNFAWTVFQNCDDMKCVEEALAWSKRSFEGKDNAMFIDTYANILYKMGKKDEAIKWEEKAASMVSEEEKKTYIETLEKMKNGEKTWN